MNWSQCSVQNIHWEHLVQTGVSDSPRGFAVSGGQWQSAHPPSGCWPGNPVIHWDRFCARLSSLTASTMKPSALLDSTLQHVAFKKEFRNIVTGISRFIVVRFIELHRCCVFLQIEGETLHQQNDYNSFDCETPFIAVVWNRTSRIFEVYLCMC